MPLYDLATSLKNGIDPYLFFVLSFLSFMLGLIRTSPLDFNHDAHFHERVLVFIRKICLIAFPLMALPYPFFVWLMYTAEAGMTMQKTVNTFFTWYERMAWYWLWPVGWYIVAFALRIYGVRYGIPYLSHLKRQLRVTQKTEERSDIRNEKEKYQPKTFLPENYYKKDLVYFGLDQQENPIYIAIKDWYESNLQLLGPTRVGKGVLLGILIQQAILRGDFTGFVDPKGDPYIPHIMADAALKCGRLFIYLDLNDPTENSPNPGEWAPFVGGDMRSRRARILTAFGMHNTGNESDFYKGKERKILDELLSKTNGRLSLMLEEFEKTPELQEKSSAFICRHHGMGANKKPIP